jgi:PKD repeat protein
MLLFACLSLEAQQQDYSIRLISRKALITENADQVFKGAIGDKLSYSDINDRNYTYIQFYKTPDKQIHNQLNKMGINLLSYFPPYAYYVSIPSNLEITELKSLGIRSIFKLKQSDKILPPLGLFNTISDANKIGGKIDVIIKFVKDINIHSALNELQQDFDIKIVKTSEMLSNAEVLVSYDNLNKISSYPYVLYIGAKTMEQDIEVDNNNIEPHHHLAPIHSSLDGHPNLTGEGVTVAVGDNHFAGDHIDFTGRVTKVDYGWQGSNHGIHVTGTVAGAGNMNEKYTGVAPKANIISCIFDDTYDYVDNHPEVVLCTHSTGKRGDCDGPVHWGQYTLESAEMDERINNKIYLMETRSAGNYGAGCIGDGYRMIRPGVNSSKSTITVGAFSDIYRLYVANNIYSKGPAYDGRIKPEIVAIGSLYSTIENQGYAKKSGTSMSTPAVAGILTLMHQKYKQDHNGGYPDNALMKAIICNTARDIRRSGPDFANGFGYVNARRAYKTIDEERYVSTEINQDGSFDYNIIVPDNVDKLKVMICWNDPAGNPQVIKALVNDIDLSVTNPNNNNFLPWVLDTAAVHLTDDATRGRDSINCIEQVTIDNPQSGTYTATIQGYEIPNGENQKVWLTYDIILKNEIHLTYPIGGEKFTPDEKITISWDYNGGYKPSNSLSFSSDNGANWTVLFKNDFNSFDDFGFIYNLPDIQSDQCLIKLTMADSVRISDTFTIMENPDDFVAIHPNNSEVLLSWRAVNGATGYNIYKLGDKYMELIGSTNERKDTITGLDIENEDVWIAVSAQLNNGESRRTLAVKAVEVPTTLPNVKFKAYPTSFPKGFSVQFSDSSTNYCTDWIWSFPGGTPSSSIEKFPKVTYNASGKYEVSLKAYNYYGDSTLTKEMYINVYNDGDCVDNFPFVESFENVNLNLWKQDDTDDFDWTIYSGITPTNGSGPYEESDGKYYIYTEADNHLNQAARINSPCLDFTNITNTKIVFNYQMHSQVQDDCGTLFLQATSDGTNWDTLWIKSGNQGFDWLSDTVDLSAYDGNQSVKLKFCVTIGDSFYSDIAIDNLRVLGHKLPVTDFFADQTDVAQSTTVNFTDISTNSPTSWAWEFEGGTPQTDNSQNPSITYNTPGTYKVTLTITNENGSDTKTKDNYITVNALPNADFDGCGAYETNDEISFTNNSTNADSYEWTFNGGNPSSSTDENPSVSYGEAGNYSVRLIAISQYGRDTLTTESCIEITNPTQTFCENPITDFPFSEGFESGLGDFIQDQNDDFDWTNHSGSTPSSATGPSAASQGSKYIYTESSSPHYPNKTAILYSPCFDLSQINNAKIKLDYHMYGVSMGTFEIAIKTENDDWQAVFTKSGDQGNQWHSLTIDVSQYDEVIKIRFKGTTTNSYTSDIAIDNFVIGVAPVAAFTANETTINQGESINFTDQSTGNPTSWKWEFGGGNTSTEQNPTITFNNTGTFTVKLIAFNAVTSDTIVKNDYITVNQSSNCTATPYSQSFENTIGSWVQDNQDDINWTINDGGTSSVNTGPSGAADGTYYIYIEASNPNYPGKVANLISPCFDLSGLANPSLSFQYHMYGAAMGTLKVQISTDDGANWATLWTKSGNQGDSWKDAIISLSDYANNANIKIRLNGETGSSYTSDICIDDLSIETSTLSCTTLISPEDESANVAISTDLEWNAAIVATGYKIFFGTDNPPTNIKNGTDIGNVTTYDPDNDLDENTTYYWKIVPYDNSGDADGCSIWSFTTTDGSCAYCQISYSNIDDDYISKVVFNNINNSSQSTTYSDFTNISTDIEKGQQYNLSIDITVNGNWFQYAKAWFDWNGDCDFTDDGEEYDLDKTPGSQGTHTLTVNVTVPDDAIMGQTRLRIAEHYNNYPTSCLNAQFGEAEDYSVNVIDGGKSAEITSEIPNGLRIYPNPVNGGFLNIEASEKIKEVYVYSVRGDLAKHISVLDKTKFKMKVGNLDIGVYFLKIIYNGGVYTERLIVK